MSNRKQTNLASVINTNSVEVHIPSIAHLATTNLDTIEACLPIEVDQTHGTSRNLEMESPMS